MDSVEQLGNKAYQRSMWGDYKGAVAILSKAIAKYPFDERLYNDRSFYSCKLKNYTNALNDAEVMLKLCPAYPRAHFRKGEVLMDMKKYEEAECVFNDLLKLDPSCKEANFYLLDAQVNQLTKGGDFWVLDAKRALELNDFNTQQAKLFLKFGGGNSLNDYDKSDVGLYYSDEEVAEEPWTVKSKPVGGRKPNNCQEAGDRLDNDPYCDPFTDPSNPFQSNSLWVGNVTSKITEQILEPIFSKYGRIKSMCVQHNNSCAFINYVQPEMASNAMRNFPKIFQTEDTYLVIRFPESAKTKKIPNPGSKPTKKK